MENYSGEYHLFYLLSPKLTSAVLQINISYNPGSPNTTHDPTNFFAMSRNSKDLLSY